MERRTTDTVHTTEEALRIGELFCGPGGIGRAAMDAAIHEGDTRYSFRHVWANDLDGPTCRTYRRNVAIPPESVYEMPVDRFVGLMPELEDIDLLTFGFPCNDFSQVGERRGLEGAFGPLYTYGVEFLKHFKPGMFLAENVGGLRSANGGKAFQQILAALTGCGYAVTAHLYKFEEYGVPQARHRVVLIGVNQEKHPGVMFRVPRPTTPGDAARTCRQALDEPPIPHDAPNQEITRQSVTVVRRLEHIGPGENAWNANLPDDLKLNVKGALISQIYRRLDPTRPSYTVTGSGGGGTHVYHWEEPRALTNRERARLQTFPDDFVFEGKKEQVRRQIGMAVPVEGARQILIAMLKTYAGVPYESVPASIDLADVDQLLP